MESFFGFPADFPLRIDKSFMLFKKSSLKVAVHGLFDSQDSLLWVLLIKVDFRIDKMQR